LDVYPTSHQSRFVGTGRKNCYVPSHTRFPARCDATGPAGSGDSVPGP
jgi:hypothetical protein